MAIKTKPALLAILLGTALSAGTALAQTAEAPATDATATEAPASDAPATDAPATDAPATDAPATDAPATDAPADADGEPQIGAYYLKETHGDWQVRCIRAPEGPDPCELFQLLRDSVENPVAEATIIPLSGGQVAAGMTITAPLETDLVAGLGLRVDQGQAVGYPFNVCVPIGCISRVGLTEAELNGFKRGAAATVTLLPFGADVDNRVELPMSLTGFTAGMNALTAYVAEMQAPPAAQ